MSKSTKVNRCLTGYLMGWDDDLPEATLRERQPYRYLKLATPEGELAIKIPKRLRLQAQTWPLGASISLECRERIDLDTGARRLKVKKLISAIAAASDLSQCQQLEPTKIKICQGSSCRRKGSDQICQAICTYLADNNLTDRVEVESTKCLHQCKSAPHAIFSTNVGDRETKKNHYRQLHSDRLQAILTRYWPQALLPKSLYTYLHPDRFNSYTNI